MSCLTSIRFALFAKRESLFDEIYVTTGYPLSATDGQTAGNYNVDAERPTFEPINQ